MKKIKLLIVEDNSIDKRLMEELLSEAEDIEFEFSHAFRLKEAFNFLHIDKFDIVTLDLGLPDSHGIETFERFNAAFPDIPTIVVSGFEDPETAKKVIANGGHGLIVKGNFDHDSLVKEIKLAINKQDFRNRVEQRISTNNINSIKEKTEGNESIRKNQDLFLSQPKQDPRLSEREPEIFQEIVTEFLHLIPLSSGINSEGIKNSVAIFFDKNKEAFAMLGLNKQDLADIHNSALGRLNFIDKNNANFKSLNAILFQEVNLAFSSLQIPAKQ